MTQQNSSNKNMAARGGRPSKRDFILECAENLSTSERGCSFNL